MTVTGIIAEFNPFHNGHKSVSYTHLVQQATAQVLDWAYDRDFSQRSFGFRRNMRAHHALRIIAAEADQGYRWAVDMDLANDNVPVFLQQSSFACGTAL